MSAMADPNDSVTEKNEQDLEIVDTHLMRVMYNDSNHVNRQIQHINHIQINNEEIIFIIQNMLAMVEIHYNQMNNEILKIRLFQR